MIGIRGHRGSPGGRVTGAHLRGATLSARADKGVGRPLPATTDENLAVLGERTAVLGGPAPCALRENGPDPCRSRFDRSMQAGGRGSSPIVSHVSLLGGRDVGLVEAVLWPSESRRTASTRDVPLLQSPLHIGDDLIGPDGAPLASRPNSIARRARGAARAIGSPRVAPSCRFFAAPALKTPRRNSHTLRRQNATVKPFSARSSSSSRRTVDGRAKVALAAFLARLISGGSENGHASSLDLGLSTRTRRRRVRRVRHRRWRAAPLRREGPRSPN